MNANGSNKLPRIGHHALAPLVRWFWLVGWLCVGIALVFLAAPCPQPSVADAATFQTPTANGAAFAPIEEIRVGQKVHTDIPPDAIMAPEDGSSEESGSAIDRATWKRVQLQATERWLDGTVDEIEIETLQPPEWFADHDVRVAGDAPIPLDLVEMGLPPDMRAQVVAIAPCPPIASGPGRCVLTTVNSLSRDVWELTVRCADDREETIRCTGNHKFYSETRRGWVSAKDLRATEELDGATGRPPSCEFARCRVRNESTTLPLKENIPTAYLLQRAWYTIIIAALASLI